MYSKPQPTQNSSQKLDLISRKEIRSLFSVFPWLLGLRPGPGHMSSTSCSSARSRALPPSSRLSPRVKPLCPAASLLKARDKNARLLLPCCLMFKCFCFMGFASDYVLVASKEDLEKPSNHCDDDWTFCRTVRGRDWYGSDGSIFPSEQHQSPPPREDGWQWVRSWAELWLVSRCNSILMCIP